MDAKYISGQLILSELAMKSSLKRHIAVAILMKIKGSKSLLSWYAFTAVLNSLDIFISSSLEMSK